MIAMGGHRQPKSTPGMWPGQDATGAYATACAEFASSLGWEAEDVCYWWSQIALTREKHAREPRAIAEYLAMRNVREALDCRGRAAS